MIVAVAFTTLVVGLIVWLVGRYLRGPARLAVLKRKLNAIEKERQQIINDSARSGTTVSTDAVLRYTEELKAAYVQSGQEEEAREVERVIREFREQHGAEIPIDEAYALMKELERKHGQ